MAPKPKKMSDADKAYLNRLLKAAKSGKGAMADGSLSNDQKMALSALKLQQKQATAYSPKPMSMRAADKAVRAGKATQAKVTARKPKAGSGVASKVASRAKSIAREVRDVPTAVGTSVMGYLNPHGIVARGPSTKNLAKQVKEAGRAVLTGKKGTASDRNTRSVRGEFGSSTGKYGYEKGKKRK
jgi:hypothetical protein